MPRLLQSVMSELPHCFVRIPTNRTRPDEPSQLNMGPAEFAGWWKSDIEKLAALYDLWSPAVTGPGDRGKLWFENFVNSCNGGCSVSSTGAHVQGMS